MAEAKVLTKHPGRGRSGRSIRKTSYDSMKRAIVKVLRGKELTHTELADRVTKELKGKFEGNIGWYAETVKLDLEARKVVERTTSKPQKYRLK